MSKLPKIHQLTEVSDGLFTIEKLDLEFSNGVRRQFQRVKTIGLGAVIVVPMLDENTVLLVREYAAGIHAYELGLPKGRIEKGETLLEGANRELQEEAGYAARQLEELTSLTLAPGYMTHRTFIVLARDLYPNRLPGDEPEELEVVPWDINKLEQLVAREDCTEGRTIAALYIARDHLHHQLSGDQT